MIIFQNLKLNLLNDILFFYIKKIKNFLFKKNVIRI